MIDEQASRIKKTWPVTRTIDPNWVPRRAVCWKLRFANRLLEQNVCDSFAEYGHKQSNKNLILFFYELVFSRDVFRIWNQWQNDRQLSAVVIFHKI